MDLVRLFLVRCAIGVTAAKNAIGEANAGTEIGDIFGPRLETDMHPIFSEMVKFKAPEGFLQAVSAAWRRQHMTASKFLRRAAIERMQECGVSLGSEPDQD